MKVKKTAQVAAARGDSAGGLLLSRLDALPQKDTSFADFKKGFDGLFGRATLLAQEHVDRLLDHLFSKHFNERSTIWFLYLLCALKLNNIYIKAPMDALEVLRQHDADKLLACLLHRRAISVCVPQITKPPDNSQSTMAASFDQSTSVTTNRIKSDLQTLTETMDVNDTVRQRLYNSAQMNTLHLLQRQYSYWATRAFDPLLPTNGAALTTTKEPYEKYLVRAKGDYEELSERHQAIFHYPVRFKRLGLRNSPLHRYHLHREGPKRARTSPEIENDVTTRSSSTSLLEDAHDMPSLF